MSRAAAKASPMERLRALGPLAAIDIGLETIVLPAAAAHKLLPLLEKAAIADRGFSMRLRGDTCHLTDMVRPAYRLLQDGCVFVGPRPDRDDDGGA